MSGQNELEWYEQTEAQDLIRLLTMSSAPRELRAPPDFRLKVLNKINTTKASPRQWTLAWLSEALVPAWTPALTAVLLVLSIGANVWLATYVLRSANPVVDPMAAEVQGLGRPMRVYVFQRSLRQDADLGTLIAARETEFEPKTYGFAAKTSSEKSFLLGTLYAEALALVSSGNLEAATQRWQVIDRALGQTSEPLHSYRRDVQQALQQGAPALERVQSLLPLFESFYEVDAARQHAQTLPLFQAGAWMTNIHLAARAGDVAGLRRDIAVAYFLSRLEVPKGVEERLERLGELLAKKTLSEREIKTVDKLVIKMQQILS